MGFLLQYEVATLPSDADADWERSPFAVSQNRAAGLVQISNRAWRARSGRGTVQIITVNHPRLVPADMKATLRTMLDNMAWMQRLVVLDRADYQIQIPGGVADALRLNVQINLGDVAPGSVGILPPRQIGNAGDGMDLGGVSQIINALPLGRAPAQQTQGSPLQDPGLPPAPLGMTGVGVRAYILGMTWQTKGVNGHLYFGTAVGDTHRDDVLAKLPASLAYAQK